MPVSLADIVADKRREVAARKEQRPAGLFARSLLPAGGRFLSAVQGPGRKLVTEIKPSSPSAGVLRADIDIERLVAVYDRYAAAISVLTDSKYFGGSLALLSSVAGKSTLPVLLKDFVVDPYQVLEARAAGAEAVLLIVKILDDGMLGELYAAIAESGMTPVVEIGNESELERALAIRPSCLLINNRDLDTFSIDLGTTARLAALIPAGTAVVSASGISSGRDIAALEPYASAFLVGTSLMRSGNLEATLKDLSGQ